MKKTFLFICLLIFCAAYSSFAQANQAKDELFGKIAKLTQTKKPADQDKAWQLSKEFLSKYGADNDEKVQKIKEFFESYRTTTFNKKLNENKTAEAFTMGKEMLAENPDDVYVTMNLAYAGYDVFTKNKDKTYSADSIKYANKTLALFDQGKTPKSFEPFKDKDETLATMYYIIGTFNVDNDLKTAAEDFYKSVQYDSKIKTTAYPYYIIAFSYDKQFEKAAKDFQAKHGTKAQEDAEMRADNARLEKIVKQMMDAYARAIKYAEPGNPSVKGWRSRFTEIYKFVNQSEDGMDTYLNQATSSPLPDPNSI